jgi:type IV pilus assembly protein PilM
MAFLGKLFGGGASKSVLGIDISSSSIKVVQVKPVGGSALLETYGELALGPYMGLERGQATNLPANKMSGALKDLLKEANVTTKDCGVAIPMSSSLITIIKMPDVGKKKLETMVPIEMRKYIPVPISEVLIDWRLVPEESKAPTYATGAESIKQIKKDQSSLKPIKSAEVFVVAIHKETIENYTRIIKGAGLNPTFFEIEIFSTIRTVSAKPGEAVMVIDLGAGTTKVYVVESGIVRESHVVNRGSQNISVSISKALGVSMDQAEVFKTKEGLLDNPEFESSEISRLVVGGILGEANRVLLSYQKRFNKNVSKVVLTGGGSILRGLVDVANKNLSSEAIISSPFSNLKYPAVLDDTLKLAGPEFAVSIGVALRKLEESG